MASLEITTTIPCTNFCTYCPQSLLIKKYGKKEQNMTLDTFKNCIDKVPNNVHITFAGYAEPFMNPQCIDFIEYANQIGRTINIYTTLVGLTIEQVNRLSKVNINALVLHLPDDTNQMRANVDEEYKNVLKRTTAILPVSSSHVYGKLHKELVGLIRPREFELTNQHLHTRANNVKSDKLALKPHDWMAGNIKCGVIVRENGSIININVLLPNGDVTLCCMDYGLEHKIGNLLEISYESLFTSDEYKRVEAGLVNDSIDILCRTCKEAVYA
jgi:sulfatase maturation enzyme AslB (radical SAM superfamily)